MEFQQSHKFAEATKNVRRAKVESTVDRRTVTILLGWKNLNNQEISGRYKTVDSKVDLRSKQENPLILATQNPVWLIMFTK